MKHLILSIFLFICAATSQAQELTIKEFREVTNVLKTDDIHPPKTGISVHFSDFLS